MRYQGVLFDLDGTLGDTLPLCIAAFHEAIEPLVGRRLTDAEIIATFGPSEEGTVRALAPERSEEGMAAYLHRYEQLHPSWPEPFEGVRELLRLLEAEGVRVGIVTGKGPRSTEITFAQFGLAIPDVETGSPDGPCKAQGIRDVVARWGLDPARVVYVGDAVSDVRAAREAGIAVVSAAWAATADPAALREAGADAVFESLEDLATWLASADG